MIRQLKEMGIQPILALIIAIIGLTSGTLLLYSKTELAPWIIVIIGLSILIKASENNRVNHLKTIFNTIEFRRIRILENSILTTSFLLILIIQLNLVPAFVLVISSILLSFYKSKKSTNFTIPTPFSKRPFEFTSGFRKTILAFIGVIILFVISIKFENFNLGVFCLISIFLITISYYSSPEEKLFVWIFNDTPKQFIQRKIKIAIRFSLLLSAPLIITLLILKPEQYFVITVFSSLGLLALITMVIAK